MHKIWSIILSFYIGLVLINALILPPINFISIDNVIFPFAFIGTFFLFGKKQAFKWSFVIVILSVCSSLMSNYLADGVSIQELLWGIRILKTFTVGWSVFYLLSHHFELFNKLLFYCFIGFVSINALQLLEWNFILELYAPNQQMVDALNNSYLDGRIFGVTTNPNSNGLILALFGFYYFISNEKNKYILVAIAGLLVLMTQSRTAFIAFAIAMMALLLFKFLKKGKKYVFIFLTTSAITLLLIVNLKLNNLSSLFDGSAFQSHSLLNRFDVISQVLKVNESSFVFGQGKVNNMRELVGGSIDNEYAFVFLEYGLVGILILLITITFLIILASKKNFNKQAIGLLLIMFVCGLTNLSFSSLEVSALFILLFVAATFVKSGNQLREQNSTIE
ncbi:MAG TPA: hypothetical protein EYG86_00695 [Crocinitomicaceae bacterium]|nr:hypothetical protein [Crocinitomicaceae bacterium]